LSKNSNDCLNIFIDVGSCIGSYTNNLLKMAEKLDNFIIYSFEPNELNFKTLTKNKNEKIIYKKLALSNKKIIICLKKVNVQFVKVFKLQNIYPNINEIEIYMSVF